MRGTSTREGASRPAADPRTARLPPQARARAPIRAFARRRDVEATCVCPLVWWLSSSTTLAEQYPSHRERDTFAFPSVSLRFIAMPKRPTQTARKQPRQARSQATVNAVLEATVQVLERDGVD